MSTLSSKLLAILFWSFLFSLVDVLGGHVRPRHSGTCILVFSPTFPFSCFMGRRDRALHNGNSSFVSDGSRDRRSCWLLNIPNHLT